MARIKNTNCHCKTGLYILHLYTFVVNTSISTIDNLYFGEATGPQHAKSGCSNVSFSM